jgi:hypothetical protein
MFFSCTWALNGSVKNNRYYSHTGNVSVTVPPLKSISITDGNNQYLHYVDFLPGKYGWMIDHGYSLEWIHFKKPLSENRKREILSVLPNQLRKSFIIPNAYVRFNAPTCKYIMVQNVKAYQCRMIGVFHNLPTESIGTSFYKNDYLINIFMIYPTDQKKAPIQEYNSIVNSVKIR